MITGFLCSFGGVSVEPEGFEPSSKQATTMLSTCLVSVWFSTYDRPETAYRMLSFCCFYDLSEAIRSLC